jgi:hypothetical protein
MSSRSRSRSPPPPQREEEEKGAPPSSFFLLAPPRFGKEDAKKTIPEKTWRGERPGYYFGRNEKNVLGYHFDAKANDDDDEVWRETWVRVASEKEKEKREIRERTMKEMLARKKRRKEEDPDDYKGGKKEKKNESGKEQLTKREREQVALERLKKKREEADAGGFANARRGGGGDWRRREGGARGGFGRHNRTGSGELFDGKDRDWSSRR